MTEYQPPQLFHSLTAGTCRMFGISVFMMSCMFFWVGFIAILIRQLSMENLTEIYLSLIILGIGVLGMCASMNIIINPEWRLIIWFVLPCSFFSLISVIFLVTGYPDSWNYPTIGYISSFFIAGLALLILNIFLLLATRSDQHLQEEKRQFVSPMETQKRPIRYLSLNELANPVDALESGALFLIGRIEDLTIELEKTKKKSVSEHRKVLISILDVADALESIISTLHQRVLDGENSLKKIVNNFRSVRIKLEQVLTTAGVHPIETPDNRANPGTHTILEARIRPDLDDYTIIEEVQKGYVWNGQILREAIVIVGMKQGVKDV
jgi:molecular chaperone GrpE